MKQRALAWLCLVFGVAGCVRDTPGYCEVDSTCAQEQHCDTLAFACVEGAPRKRTFKALLEGGAVSGGLELSLSTDGRVLRFRLQHAVVDATGAHLHRGQRGQNEVIGPVLCTLGAGKDQEEGSCAVKTEGGAEDLTLGDLEGGQVYADVHSAARPDGEIRGAVVSSGN